MMYSLLSVYIRENNEISQSGKKKKKGSNQIKMENKLPAVEGDL